ncbi:hypothetical protein VKT23_011993 [Stygiomarasmius scandens]|uniref:Uncharacterized protein n=1 Tax=Marasmiellus scandens TaxID=2682957 RepID=A0ABR1JD22_9AGAR
MASNNRNSTNPRSGGNHFFGGTSSSTFNDFTLNSVGGNQANDQRSGRHYNGNIYGGYVEYDQRNLQNAQTIGERTTDATFHLSVSQSKQGHPQWNLTHEILSNISPFEEPMVQQPAVGTTPRIATIHYSNLPQRHGIFRADCVPEPMQNVFHKIFAPKVIEFTGTLEPWSNPEPDKLKTIWEQIQAPQPDASQWEAIQKATSELLDNWRSTFGDVAIKVLKEYFDNVYKTYPELKDSKKTQTFIDTMRDGYDHKRIYYFLHPFNKNRELVYEGPFQSEIVSMTFSVHLKAISIIPNDDRLQERATGAIALSILALERALCYYISGIPNDSEGAFSKANWENKVLTVNDKPYNVNSKSVRSYFMPFNPDGSIRLSSEKWTDIVNASMEHVDLGVANQHHQQPAENGENFSY